MVESDSSPSSFSSTASVASLLPGRLPKDARFINKLEVGSLYLVAYIPSSPYFNIVPHYYLPYLPDNYDVSTYEIHTTTGLSREEFHWDLYYHNGPSTGTIYRLNRNRESNQAAFKLEILRDIHHIRSMAQLVGLVRVLSVPPHQIAYLGGYLEWRVPTMAPIVYRSCVWAVGVCSRAREHLSRAAGVLDHTGRAFDATFFLAECLGFLYREVPYAMRGVKPRPILISDFGVRLNMMSPNMVEESRRARDFIVGVQRRTADDEMARQVQAVFFKQLALAERYSKKSRFLELMK